MANPSSGCHRSDSMADRNRPTSSVVQTFISGELPAFGLACRGTRAAGFDRSRPDSVASPSTFETDMWTLCTDDSDSPPEPCRLPSVRSRVYRPSRCPLVKCRRLVDLRDGRTFR